MISGGSSDDWSIAENSAGINYILTLIFTLELLYSRIAFCLSLNHFLITESALKFSVLDFKLY